MTSLSTQRCELRPLPQRRRQRGITVIELLVALAVVGLLMIVGYQGIRHVRQSDLREGTVEIASILRNAYNLATSSGIHHRVVFDLDEQTFAVEACEGEIKLSRKADEIPTAGAEGEELRPTVAADSTIPPEILAASSPEEAAKIAQSLSGGSVGGAQCAPTDGRIIDYDNRGAMRKLATERGIKLRRVYVQHREDPTVSGKVTINFFPLGYAEKAIVEIADEDGNQYTLLVHGLTGRVEFRDGELRDPNSHMMRNAAGDRMEER